MSSRAALKDRTAHRSQGSHWPAHPSASPGAPGQTSALKTASTAPKPPCDKEECEETASGPY